MRRPLEPKSGTFTPTKWSAVAEISRDALHYQENIMVLWVKRIRPTSWPNVTSELYIQIFISPHNGSQKKKKIEK